MAFASGIPYFVDEPASGGYALFEQPLGSGVVSSVQQFGGIPCQSTSLATGPNGDFYVVQYCSAEVLEYKPGPAKKGKPKKPVAVYTGGNFGASMAEPTY